MIHEGFLHFSDRLKGKHVLIFGLGLLGGGEHVARMCHEAGAQVRVTDQKSEVQLEKTMKALADLPLTFSLGGHKEEDVMWADVVIKNPSVPSSHPLIQKALELNKEVTTEAALYLQYTVAHTIGITGTRGKTTTTYMVYEMLKQSYPSVLMGGNIQGISALELLKEETKETWTVLELSSWQLEGCHWAHVSPHIAAITNLNEDHMNRYASMEAYAYDKAAICMYQKETDTVVLNAQDVWTPFFGGRAKGQKVIVDESALPKSVVLKVKGEHNRMNAAIAYTVGLLAGCSEAQALSSLESFGGVPYRFEQIRTVSGVAYINDTTSTTPAALHVALLSAKDMAKESHGNIVLIAGGASKGLNMNQAVEDMNAYADTIVLLKGTGTDEIASRIHPNKLKGVYDDMAKAVKEAADTAKSGDIVLLSPGCASFGIFTNEFDRGEQFNASVRQL